MNCETFCALIDDYLDQELTYEPKRAWLEHRRECAACALLAEQATKTHAAIAAATTAYADSIPTTSRPLQRAGHSNQQKLAWWWGSAVAATLLIGVGLLSQRSQDFRPSITSTTLREPPLSESALWQRINELQAIKAWQDDLVQSLNSSHPSHSDRLWRLVACTYLPPERVPHAVVAHLPTANDDTDQPPAAVVSWQRTTRRGNHTTGLKFTQLTDGSVHIEQSITSPEEETVTRVDAASWDLLRQQHATMCRELGLFDPANGIQAGWPLPARGQIERDAQRVLRGESVASGLATRLLTLKLATSVTGPEELTTAMQKIAHRSWPEESRPALGDHPTSAINPKSHYDAPSEQLSALEKMTGGARYSDDEWKLAMHCLNPKTIIGNRNQQ